MNHGDRDTEATEKEICRTIPFGTRRCPLGPGFLESIYQRAMVIELRSREMSLEPQRSVRVAYRSVEIPGQRIDLIVEGLVVVELKAISRFDQIHTAQVISYLKTTGLRAGLLINFRVPLLHMGIRRIVV